MRGRLQPSAAALLMPPAVLAVHQLRYRLAFGSDAGRELAIQGHGYLVWAEPVVVVLASMAVGGLLARVIGAWFSARPELPARRRFAAAWITTALVLLAVYAAQELLEGLLAHGHPRGLAAVAGDGGWWAIPAALAVAASFAALLDGARRAATFAAARSARRRTRARARRADPPRPSVQRRWRRGCPLATACAGRAPPRRRHAVA